MGNLHEIKGRINNVNSTKKITRAMYLISASKSQKAKRQLESVSPYFHHITETMTDILAGAEEIDTPYILRETPEVEKRPSLFIVLGGDKGMAGGYNHNLLACLKEHAVPGVDDVMVAGVLGRIQVGQMGFTVGNEIDCPVMNPNVYRAREVAEQVVEKYNTKKYRAINLIYTSMINALKQEPVMMPLLPLDTIPLSRMEEHGVVEEIEYRPSAREVFDHLVPHYLKGVIYSAFVEAFASEQHARMYAMDGATKNANDTINQLSINYNRARQAMITQELSEIVGGIPED